jgi:hypothetical protein
MTASRLRATLLTTVALGTLLSSCNSGHGQAKAITSAAPGRFTTVIGTGPEGNPDSNSDWFEDPIDLALRPHGGIFVLTKENGRVVSILPNGSHKQDFTLDQPGEALSMAVRADGVVLVAQKVQKTGKLAVWASQPNLPARKIDELPSPRNVESVHLVTTPEGKVLLLRDGQFLEQDSQEKFHSTPTTEILGHHRNVLAAVSDGKSLMLLLPDALIWTEKSITIRRVPVLRMDSNDGATIAPDGSGGAYKARYGPAVEHYSARGREGSILLGYGGISACGSGRPSGPTGDAHEQKFDSATALLRAGTQLFFTDPNCHRVLVIGLPAKEYISSN